MDNTSTVNKFYSNIADNYINKFNAPPLSWIRYFETKALIKYLPDIINKDIIELGCGTGYYTEKLLRYAPNSITAIDLEPKMLAKLPKNDKIIAINADVTTLDLKQQYHLAFSAGMLEFVANPLQVLIKTHSLLKPGATFILLIPTKTISGFFYKMYHKRNNININLFEINSFKLSAKHTGWKVKNYRTCGLFSMAIELERLS